MSQAQRLTQVLSEIIRRNLVAGTFTPEVVLAFASLSLTDDAGRPITAAPHHRLWMRLACDERIKKLLIISPPESAKTTWFVNAFLGSRLGFYPDSNNIIASIDSETAMKRSMTLRTMVLDPSWTALFPRVVPAPGMKWEQTEWSLSAGGVVRPGRLHPTIRAYGTGQSIIGSRADLVLCDDLIDFNLARTEGERDRIRSWFHNSLLSRRKTNGRVIVIGTMWNAGDLYADLRANPQGWVICHTPLLGSTGAPFYADISYPDDWPYEMLGDEAMEVLN